MLHGYLRKRHQPDFVLPGDSKALDMRGGPSKEHHLWTMTFLKVLIYSDHFCVPLHLAETGASRIWASEAEHLHRAPWHQRMQQISFRFLAGIYTNSVVDADLKALMTSHDFIILDRPGGIEAVSTCLLRPCPRWSNASLNVPATNSVLRQWAALVQKMVERFGAPTPSLERREQTKDIQRW